MTRFRPCIDLHQGKVKQIVGGTLNDTGAGLRTNFVSEKDARWYADLYRRDDLGGGHVILLGPGNREAALEALRAFPGGLQIGGGLDDGNVAEYLDAGASHVILTSWLFPEGKLAMDRLERILRQIGRERLVVDLSCRRRAAVTAGGRNGGETRWFVAMNRWQTITSCGWMSPCSTHCRGIARIPHPCRRCGRPMRGMDWDLVGLLGAHRSPTHHLRRRVPRHGDLGRLEKVSGPAGPVHRQRPRPLRRKTDPLRRLRRLQRRARLSPAHLPWKAPAPRFPIRRIPGRPAASILVRSPRKEEILDVSLVLASQGIKHWIEFDGREFSLSVEEGSPPLARELLEL